ncbi:MAG: 3D domain-containing protein [Spirochaetes bacterium]|jgi:3D (Asp-Asp-Asp) domain-containing protein|nr:3D domain-containing protein [Spirochaetota bacterium]
MIRKAFFFGSVVIGVTILAAFVLSEAMVKKESFAERMLETRNFRDGRTVELVCEITAYCPGPCCNTEYISGEDGPAVLDWSDRLAVGGLSITALLGEGLRPAAVDTSIIPFGSVIDYEGVLYVALDRGGAIKGARLDLALPSHEECVLFGRRAGRSVTVYVPNSPSRAVRMIREKFGDAGGI